MTRRLWAAACVFLLAAVSNSLTRADLTAQEEPLLRIESGMHTAVISNMSLSSDEQWLATASDDKTVRIWSLPDGRLSRILRPPIGAGDEGQAWSVALSPDGSLVAVAGKFASKSVHIFERSTGALIRRLDSGSDIVPEMTFSKDGRRLAAGTGSGIRVWDATDWENPAIDRNECPNPFGLAYDRSGRLAVGSFGASALCLFDSNLGLIARVTTPGGALTYRVAFSPDGNKIAVGFHDTNVVDVFQGSDLKHLFRADTDQSQHNNLVSVAWASDGDYLFASGGSRSFNDIAILRWGEGGRGPMEQLRAAETTSLALRPYGKRGLAFVAYGPAFGLIDDDLKVKLLRRGNQARMRENSGRNLAVSADAHRVRFGTDKGGKDPWIFDLNNLSLLPAPTSLASMHPPNTSALNIAGWPGKGRYPLLNGKELPGVPGYVNVLVSSLSIAPNAKSFVLGTEWHLSGYGSSGTLQWSYVAPGQTWGVNTSSNGQIIVAAYDDGTIRWHRADDGRELLALFIHVVRDGEVGTAAHRWVAWTPKGYYAASVGGEGLIGWHINRGWDAAADYFPASKFRETFYRPDIVQLVLETLDEGSAAEKANAVARKKQLNEDVRNRQPPVVTIRSPGSGSVVSEHEIAVEYSVRSPSGLAVTRVFALVDGRPVDGATNSEIHSQSEFTGTLTVKLPERDVSISVVAETSQNSSEPASVSVRRPDKAADIGPKPSLYALVIGVGNYDMESKRLGAFPAHDADEFTAQLKQQEGLAYEKVHVKKLKDRVVDVADDTNEATRDNILDGLQWLNDSVQDSNDVAAVFFSGHGITLPNQASYLLPVEYDGKEIRTGLNKRALLDALRDINGSVLLFIDACQAGGALDAGNLVNEFGENGIISFYSSLGSEPSFGATQNSFFTRVLVDGLKGKYLDQATTGEPRVVMSYDFDKWLYEQVGAMSNHKQTAGVYKPPQVQPMRLAIVK